VDEVTVGSWHELNELLYEGSWSEDIGRFRASMAFRGADCAEYNLTTSLSRLGGGPELERVILRAFQKYAQTEDVPRDSIWNWLALAQHHGLPTRLLDWTYSPLVAMHFATENLDRFHEDGMIWAVDFSRTNEYLPDQLKVILKDERSFVFTAGMLDQAASTLTEFDRLSDRDFVVYFEPPSLDARIVNQYALFSLLSNPDLTFDCWLDQHDGTSRRIVIPARLKWEIRDKLDQANITERVLYPGLDGLSRWLRRYYAPASRQP
jgi:hypothetical protein